MDTNRLKRFAKEARIKLLQQISLKLEYVLGHDSAKLRGKEAELKQLQAEINRVGKAQVIDAVAYTWFNRLMALRFMDANGYNIPKAVTPASGMSIPEILQNAQAGSIDAYLKVDRDRIRELLTGRATSKDTHGEVYRMLLVALCNYWHTAMPFMFEQISDFTELLLPEDLLSDYSIVTDIRNGMTNEDCLQEEVLGWLYQFYISEENERLISSKKVYTKNELAPASQLFTPKWIVKYIVDNTLGQLYSEINPATTILPNLDFYIKPVFEDQLSLRTKKRLDEIKFFDPCVGSAHILAYAFEVFYLMYEEQGYNISEIPELIIKNNLYGIDIDERASQIAAFVLMMKGRRKNSRFLQKNIKPNITFYEDFINDAKFKNASALGSLINVNIEEIDTIKVDEGTLFAEKQQKLKFIYFLLSQRYDCVVTNPPYISSARMEGSVKKYVETNYPDTKSDLFATFIVRCLELCNEDGFTGFMTPFVWMFISSYQRLRENLIDHHFINNLIQLEYSGFDGATVPICTFTIRNRSFQDAEGCYIRLSDFKGSENQAPKTLEAISNRACGWFYVSNQNEFEKIPGSPIAYWVSRAAREIFANSPSLKSVAYPRQGLATTNNDLFLRQWFEPSISRIGFNLSKQEAALSNFKWFPINKGGSFRKWYGNNHFVINFENDGKTICDYIDTTPNVKVKSNGRVINRDKYFSEGLTWSTISSSSFSMRYSPGGSIFETKGGMCFCENRALLMPVLGYMNTKIVGYLLKALSPTLDFHEGPLGRLPIVINNSSTNTSIIQIVEQSIEISKLDWDARETSYDFLNNELIKQQKNKIKSAFETYKFYWTHKFNSLHNNEKELNRQFIEIYGLADELTPEVFLEDITILQEEAKVINGDIFIDPFPVMAQLISYSIACIFGRYSLDIPGLVLANQEETFDDYLVKIDNPSFLPDEDNIIPVLDGEYFTDDIVGKFRSWLKVAFGEENFVENLKYLEETIGKDIRKYFVKDFYNDHIKRYRKRPIYWMFTSPKGHFKALIYMHRYQPDLCSRMLNDYLLPFISKLEANKQHMTNIGLREDISTREKTKAIQEADRIELMLKDCREYAKTLFSVATQRIEIDLDDGVKVNYQKFKEVLVPIKGLEKDEE